MKQCRSNGFTLAELLLALAILGILATFSVSKILSAQNDAQRISILKESGTTIGQLLYQGRLTSAFQSTPFRQYVFDHVNATKLCDTNAETQGCWDITQGAGLGGTPSNMTGFVLHNGANFLSGWLDYDGDQGGGVLCNAIYMDWNGAQEPNTYGEDQIDIIVSYGTATESDPAHWCYDLKPGSFRFGWDDDPTKTIW